MLGGQILIGSAMIAVMVLVHVTGLVGLIYYVKGKIPSIEKNRAYIGMMRVLLLTIFGVVIVHTVEVWSWAILYTWLGEFGSMERALYFSTVTFTTLGYGDIVLSIRWQLLSGFEAVNGIILFGVSTAFVFAVMRRIFEAAEITVTSGTGARRSSRQNPGPVAYWRMGKVGQPRC